MKAGFCGSLNILNHFSPMRCVDVLLYSTETEHFRPRKVALRISLRSKSLHHVPRSSRVTSLSLHSNRCRRTNFKAQRINQVFIIQNSLQKHDQSAASFLQEVTKHLTPPTMPTQTGPMPFALLIMPNKTETPVIDGLPFP